jgi:hypothetical protein
MTRIASRLTPLAFAARTAPAVLALAALFGAAAPAAAECTGMRLTINRANAIDYVCRANCAAVPSRTLLASRDYAGHDARMCMDLCDERAGCRAISFEFIYTGDTMMTRCQLWGEGELATYDLGVYTPRMRQPGVCYRRWAPSRDPRLQQDFDRLQQDQHRPGVPGPGLPKKP